MDGASSQDNHSILEESEGKAGQTKSSKISGSEATLCSLPPLQIPRHSSHSRRPSLKPNSPPPSSPILFNQKHRYSLVSFGSSEGPLEGTPDGLTPASSSLGSQYGKRKLVMKEIVDSEIRYLADLAFVKNYRDPLLALAGTPQEILPKKTIGEIFAHYESIFTVNQELRSQLEARLQLWDSGLDHVGDIFLSLAPFLRVYTLFLTNFNGAIKLVTLLTARNPRFAAFLQEVNAMPGARGGLNLQTFLLTPVQRIPRYELLLKELIKHTPTDHPDYENLLNGLEMIAGVAMFNNETMRDHQMMLEILTIQKSLVGLRIDLIVPGRRLVKRGSVQKISRRAHQTRELILFSDMLVIASPTIMEDQFRFHRSILIDNFNAESIPDSDDVKNIFQIVNREKSFAVYTETPEEKELWVQAIKDAKSDWKEATGTLKKEKQPAQLPLVQFQAPIWMPDEECKSCLVCHKDFSFFLRKHHCRSCGILVCHPCSRNSFFIPGKDGEKKSRVCDRCLPTLVEQRRFRISAPSIGDFFDEARTDRSSIDSRRTSIDSRAPSVDMVRGSTTTGLIHTSIDSRRTSIDSRASFESTRSMGDVARLYNPNRSYSRRNSRSLDTPALLSRLLGKPPEGPASCTLCLQRFNVYCWKYQCRQCDRVACKACCSKDYAYPLCDPCSLNVDPQDVVVNPAGGSWSARFSMDSERPPGL
ncbi:hypothetical protein HDV03_000139 [Kappamyces sp. JEL0829]|nr:hypothetical protein HDV03_000139 [Kappamyces sp. JEL0829]